MHTESTVVLDFYSEYCSPCRSIGRDLEEIGKEIRLNIKKLNISDNYELTEKYNIRSVPTLVILKNDEIKNSYTGYKGIDDLKRFLSENI
jgi:thioredoxin 1